MVIQRACQDQKMDKTAAPSHVSLESESQATVARTERKNISYYKGQLLKGLPVQEPTFVVL